MRHKMERLRITPHDHKPVNDAKATWRLLSACCAVSDDEDRPHCPMKYAAYRRFEDGNIKKPTIISSEVWHPDDGAGVDPGMRVLTRVCRTMAALQSCAAFRGRGMASGRSMQRKSKLTRRECFDPACAVENVVLNAFPRRLHVWKETEQGGVVGQRARNITR